jgi:uncharacterized surface protein with fasciclin (FAS1) repeats
VKRFITLVVAVLIIAVGVFFVSCDNEELKNLLEVAQGNAELASLVNVILYVDENSTEDPDIAGGLADAANTITAFGPNNLAFVTVFGDNDLDKVVELEDIQDFRDANFAGDDAATADALLDVLGYHIILGQKLMAADVVANAGGSIGPTAADPNLNVTVVGDTVSLDPDDGSSGADIVQTDIEASNGVAHIIDEVMGLGPAE